LKCPLVDDKGKCRPSGEECDIAIEVGLPLDEGNGYRECPVFSEWFWTNTAKQDSKTRSEHAQTQGKEKG